MTPGVAFDRTDLPAGNAPLWIASDDFNHDGYLDLAVSIFSGAAVSIYLGNGAGGLQRAPDVPVGTRPWGLTAGDLSRDGHADLAARARVIVLPCSVLFTWLAGRSAFSVLL